MTGVQTCALPIFTSSLPGQAGPCGHHLSPGPLLPKASLPINLCSRGGPKAITSGSSSCFPSVKNSAVHPAGTPHTSRPSLAPLPSCCASFRLEKSAAAHGVLTSHPTAAVPPAHLVRAAASGIPCQCILHAATATIPHPRHSPADKALMVPLCQIPRPPQQGIRCPSRPGPASTQIGRAHV